MVRLIYSLAERMSGGVNHKLRVRKAVQSKCSETVCLFNGLEDSLTPRHGVLT